MLQSRKIKNIIIASQVSKHFFNIADVENVGQLSGKNAVAFLTKSKLDRVYLRQIWELSDTLKQHYLGLNEFQVAMRLVLLAQNGYLPSPTVLNETGSSREYESRISVQFYPWIPLSEESRIPCSADWVVTIVEPVKNIKKLYQERLDGRHKGNQSPIVVQSGDNSIGD